MGARGCSSRCNHTTFLESGTPTNATLVSVPLFPVLKITELPTAFMLFVSPSPVSANTWYPAWGIHTVLDSGEPGKVLPLREFMFC